MKSASAEALAAWQWQNSFLFPFHGLVLTSTIAQGKHVRSAAPKLSEFFGVHLLRVDFGDEITLPVDRFRSLLRTGIVKFWKFTS
jgi:hypothetical protein